LQDTPALHSRTWTYQFV